MAIHPAWLSLAPTGSSTPASRPLAAKPPSGPDWVHEIKHDGYRLIVRRDGQGRAPVHPPRL